MNEEGGNLLFALHHWASAQDENFTTESFVGVLRRLLELDPTTGVALVSWLTDGQITVPAEEAGGISITTQVSSDLGRPDVEIRTADALGYIEAKVESVQGQLQLHRYWKLLNRSLVAKRSLTLLSRYAEDIDEKLQGQVTCRRWYQVADFLARALQTGLIQETVNLWLTEQFIGFLQLRGMVMNQVGGNWQTVCGRW